MVETKKRRATAIFAHGFEGRPQGRKAQYLEAQLGYRVVAPSMHRFGWSLTGHIRAVVTALDENPEARLIVGSSMGGLAVTGALKQRSDRQIDVILMAPAFGIHRVWAQRIGPEGMGYWAASGHLSYLHGGVGETIELPYAFFTECRDAASLSIEQPCVVIHGRHDEIVPFEESEKLRARSPSIRQLLASNDDHRLGSSLALMDRALSILGSSPAH